MLGRLGGIEREEGWDMLFEKRINKMKKKPKNSRDKKIITQFDPDIN